MGAMTDQHKKRTKSIFFFFWVDDDIAMHIYWYISFLFLVCSVVSHLFRLLASNAKNKKKRYSQPAIKQSKGNTPSYKTKARGT